MGLRPLTARSLLASMLLGSHPPRLPVRALVAAAGLFDITEGAARTALSRMVRSGEIIATGGWYELGPALQARQQRQDRGRRAERLQWNGRWRSAIVIVDGRPAAVRSESREILAGSHFAELREGFWTRPDNLGPAATHERLDSDHWLFAALQFDTQPDVGSLWPLETWSERASWLGDVTAELTPSLEAGEPTRLARGFVLAAAGLRLLRDDPLLPQELLPSSWPADAFRAIYDRFDAAYRAVLRDFFAQSR